MLKTVVAATLAMVATASFLNVGASAQSCDLSGTSRSTLRAPLIYGAQDTPAGYQAPVGQAPAVGDGSTPWGVIPGHTSAPTLIPSIGLTPSNSINSPSYVVPHNPATQSYPGQLGPNTYAPPPPSTPGYDPGMITRPNNFYRPPVTETYVNPGGGISGSAPTQRWGGQTTQDFGRYKYQGTRRYEFGQGQMYGTPSQDGPWQTRPGAQAIQDPYGNRGYGIVQTVAPY